jgi:cyanate permease
MSLGSILAVVLVLAWSQVDSLLAFYLIWMGLGVAMAAVLYEPAFAVIAVWFARQRGRALTVLTLVGGFASVIFIPLAEQLVQVYGWRETLLILAGILGAATILPHLLVLRRHPADSGLSVDGRNVTEALTTSTNLPEVSVREALQDGAFWWMSAAFALNAFVVVALTLHLIPYLIEHGFSSTFAANAAGLVGLMVFPGRILFNVVGERIARKVVTAAIFALLSISLVILHFGATLAGVMAFVVLFGASKGAITPVRAAVVADEFGARNYASISGILLFPSTITRALAPVVVGIMFDQSGNYDLAMWLMVGLSVIALAMLVVVKRRNLAQQVATSSFVSVADTKA